MSSVQTPRHLMLRFMIRVFPGLSRTTFPSSPEHPNVVAKSQTEYKDFEKSTLQERLRNQKEQSDRYLSNIFWTIFLIKGASGSRQTSLPFFKVALQRENEDAPMHVGLKTKAGGGVGDPSLSPRSGRTAPRPGTYTTSTLEHCGPAAITCRSLTILG